MSSRTNQISTRAEFYEAQFEKYNKILELLSSNKDESLNSIVKQINETFTKKIYPEASALAGKQKILEEAWNSEPKQIDFTTYVKMSGEILSDMAALDVIYRTNVVDWMEKLQKAIEHTEKTNSHSKESLKEAEEEVESLSIKDYYTESHTIIIGIDDYAEENKLKNAVNDAMAVRDVLIEKYDFTNNIQLFNNDATKAKIDHVLVDILQDPEVIGRDDRVLLYFSGHGKIRELADKDAQGNPIKEGFMLPVDSRKDSWASRIKMDDIVSACRNCAAKHVLLILDCCFAGAITRGTFDTKHRDDKNLHQFLDALTSKPTIQVIAAGQYDEPVSDDSIIRGHSPFTAALLEVLDNDKDYDHDSVLTGKEVGSFVRATVLEYQRGKPEIQTPVLGLLPGSKNGDFVFKIFQPLKKTSMKNPFKK